MLLVMCQRISEDMAPNKDRELVVGRLPTILVLEVGATEAGVDGDQPVSELPIHTTLYMNPHSMEVVVATACMAGLEDEGEVALFSRYRKCCVSRDLCTPTVSREVKIPMQAAGVPEEALLSER